MVTVSRDRRDVVAVPSVLTVNTGSSSLQVHVVDPDIDGVVDSMAVEEPAHSELAQHALAALLSRVDEQHLTAVGYRLVHGGPELRCPTLVDDRVLHAARWAEPLAPLHIPSTLELVGRLRKRLPDVPHVLCPDTAFHADLPEVASTYALPLEWRTRYGLRRYGFHGLSYARASRCASQLLGRPLTELQLLLTHLGGGCSVCAVREGRSMQTSMGFTPLEGVVMTTRSGSIDPGLLLWLQQQAGIGVEELAKGLLEHSGLLGLSAGRSSDTRELVRLAGQGDAAARLAMEVFAQSVRRELAAEATSLDRIDALVFTGEIGWDQPEMREAVCTGLGILGVQSNLRGHRDEDGPLTVDGAGIPVLVVKPREELELAQSTMACLPPQR